MSEIDHRALAELMLDWEEATKIQQSIEEKIKTTVLALGKTQTVGNVRATYSKGRKTYDYETAGRTAPKPIIDANTEPKTDWRSVCKDAGIEAPVASQSDPSVYVKLLTS